MNIIRISIAVCMVPLAGAAHAEMKDWQLRRFLNFRSECQMDDFVDRSAATGPGRFHALCRNVTFYPDGVDLECPDRIDEWTCRILTKPLEFGNLPVPTPDHGR